MRSLEGKNAIVGVRTLLCDECAVIAHAVTVTVRVWCQLVHPPMSDLDAIKEGLTA